jgi:hypothetical protein
MGACGHTLLCQALNAATSQGTSIDRAYMVPEPPGEATGCLGPSRAEEGGERAEKWQNSAYS